MKQALQLGILSVVNIGITFLFQWHVLTSLGPGIESDALFAGMTLPQLALAVISSSLTHVLVPLLAGEDNDKLRHDVWGFLFLVGGMFTLLAAILYMTATWWVPLTVPGFNDAGKALTIELTRIQLIGMILTAINGVQWAAYHARQRFVWAEFSPILSGSLALLILMWALPRYGVIAAAWISTLRLVLQTLLLAPGAGKPVWPNLRSPTIRDAWSRIKPLLLGTTYYKTDPLVDRFLLSTAASGSLSLYYLAQQIYGAVNQVMNKATATPLVPLLSMLHKTGNSAIFDLNYYRKLMQVCAVSIVGVLFFGVFGQTALDLLIGHKNITSDNVKELWWMLIWLSGMFVGGVAGQICSSAFYACGDTTTPTRMSVYTYTCYIPCKIAGFYIWGVMGLAIVTSVYYMLNVSILIYLMKKKQIR